MLNWIFLFLIAGSILTAAWNGKMAAVSEASLLSAKASAELALGLWGQLALWLGFFGILEKGGAIQLLGNKLKPVMTLLFPDVPPDHPAMGAIIMNIAANMLGLGNAATPFGLKAMQELNHLNTQKGVATNAMILFLAINTSGVAVLATDAVAIRVTMNSSNPSAILIPSLVSTIVSTLVAILAVKAFEKLPFFRTSSLPALEVSAPSLAEVPPKPLVTPRKRISLRAILTIAVILFLGWRLSHSLIGLTFPDKMTQLSDWMIPILILCTLLYGALNQVKTYEVFVESAKEAFTLVTNIVPYLVAIMVAVGMFRASGALGALSSWIRPITDFVGFPPEALPMALIRPLSGSGAKAVMAEALQTYGPDSFIGFLVSIINGSSETTFYVLTVYYGSIQVRELRHTIWACLTADVSGILTATWVARMFF